MSSPKQTPLSTFQEGPLESPQRSGHRRRATKVTQARAKAQRAKLDHQEEQEHDLQEALPESKENEEKASSPTLQNRVNSTVP